MSRRFVLLVDEATAQEQDTVTKHLQTTPYGFWHHLSDAWLMTDRTDKLTTVELRDQIHRLLPGKTILAVRMDDPNIWAAIGHAEQFKWLNEAWNRD
ncbi:MAG: hypothetical protein ABI640_10820 [Gammaproteobacteria bacterium]